jgi:heme/copper-type cytochrome/quinol oxidase subunit 4
MIVTMCLALWGGMKLDEHFEVKNHLFTLFLLLFAVVGSLYITIKGLLK